MFACLPFDDARAPSRPSSTMSVRDCGPATCQAVASLFARFFVAAMRCIFGVFDHHLCFFLRLFSSFYLCEGARS